MPTPSVEHPRPDSSPAVPESGLITWVCLGVLLAIIAAHAADLVGGVAYPIVTFGGTVCAVWGLRHHRPVPSWPWWSMAASGLVWTAAGVAREATNATGNLSSSRSLLPDLFALPGYALFGVGLYGLLRSRRSTGDRGALLDGIMLGAGALLIVNELIIAPTLGIRNTWVMARIAVAIYPAVSMCLLVVAARLAFAAGVRSPAFRLVLIGTASLLVGDVVFALGEVGRLHVSQNVLEAPYLLVPACVGTAVMHPSIRYLARASRRRVVLGRGRLLAVAGALLAPIAVIATHDVSRSRAVTTGLCLVLAVTAIVRLGAAMREQAESEARLSHQATHDDLTGLPSRQLVVEHTDDMLSRSLSSGQTVAVMFIDLDQFKLVNDSMGHAVGDQLLMVAAQRIVSCVRVDDVVARISGDEFIVVTVGLDSAGASALADRIRRVLDDVFYLDAGEVFISASIGVTIAGIADIGHASTLIQEADTAMYRSKDAGRNTVTVFDSSMRERVARRVELERRLRHALNERDFAAYYQPLVSLPTGRVGGFEALARWRSDGQMISPAEFIPIAEESGLIVPLGAFMLDESCRQLAKWRRTIVGGERLYMAVNLSPRQIREGDIIDTVAETLVRHNLPGEALWLEITESVMMEDSIATAAVMAGLRSLGVRLSVDDFGTGFSSLSYLKRFPVSRVKIDRSFVSGIGEHQSDSSLVAAIIAMATALDLETVAEGVETREQAQHLFELGCKQAQGFLFAQAVPADEVPSTLERLGLVTARPNRSRRCNVVSGSNRN
jgi:diguanylate cyclase (GGDEF)-like protein